MQFDHFTISNSVEARKKERKLRTVLLADVERELKSCSASGCFGAQLDAGRANDRLIAVNALCLAV